MSETSALRPGQKVTLSGTVLRRYDDEWYQTQVDGATTTSMVRASALTPVVEPEPTFEPGDVVRINGINYMLCGSGAFTRWRPANDGWPLTPGNFSALWTDDRVVVVYRKEADK